MPIGRSVGRLNRHEKSSKGTSWRFTHSVTRPKRDIFRNQQVLVRIAVLPRCHNMVEIFVMRPTLSARQMIHIGDLALGGDDADLHVASGFGAVAVRWRDR